MSAQKSSRTNKAVRVELIRRSIFRTMFKLSALGASLMALSIIVYTEYKIMSIALFLIGALIIAFSPLLSMLNVYRKKLKQFTT